VAGSPRNPLLGSLLHEREGRGWCRPLDDDLDTICFTNSTNKHLDVRQRADCWQEVERMVVGKLGEWAASGQHSRSGS
jgi:hypothetical protein